MLFPWQKITFIQSLLIIILVWYFLCQWIISLAILFKSAAGWPGGMVSEVHIAFSTWQMWLLWSFLYKWGGETDSCVAWGRFPAKMMQARPCKLPICLLPVMSLFWRTLCACESCRPRIEVPLMMSLAGKLWQPTSLPIGVICNYDFSKVSTFIYMICLSDIIFCLSCILVDWRPCSTWLPDCVLMSWCLLHGWLAACVCPGKRAISLSSRSSQEAKTWSDLWWTGTQNLS